MNTQVKITYKMKELNLYRIWQIMNKVSEAQDKMHEKDLYVYLLNTRSYYVPSDFENFLNYLISKQRKNTQKFLIMTLFRMNRITMMMFSIFRKSYYQ